MDNYTCDVCGVSNNTVVAGRWIFYCPEHKQKDRDITWEQEISHDLESGNLNYILNDDELSNMLEDMF